MTGRTEEFLKKAESRGIDLGLDRMTALMELLGNPQKGPAYIHVAGTNGKGSVCGYISRILKRAGYITGRYNSPAVTGITDQYDINGSTITKEEYDRFLDRVAEASFRLKDKGYEEPTLFEVQTAIAFLYFSENSCDTVVLETGMGGRDDATNIVTGTLVSVLTSISEDHLGMIGNDLSEIAQTKAGIIKTGSFVVSAPQKPEVSRIIQSRAESFGTEPVMVDRRDIRLKSLSLYGAEFSYKELKDIKLNMGGEYQPENAAVAIEVCSCLKKAAYHISEEDIRLGLGEAVCPFRLERILEDPEFILDGAHNPGAAEGLHNTLFPLCDNVSITLIMGMFKDKDYARVCKKLAPLCKRAIALQTRNSERALSRFVLRDELERCGAKEAVTADSAEEAVKTALYHAKRDKEAGEKPLIIACGSFSFLNEVRNCCVTIHNRIAL